MPLPFGTLAKKFSVPIGTLIENSHYDLKKLSQSLVFSKLIPLFCIAIIPLGFFCGLQG